MDRVVGDAARGGLDGLRLESLGRVKERAEDLGREEGGVLYARHGLRGSSVEAGALHGLVLVVAEERVGPCFWFTS